MSHYLKSLMDCVFEEKNFKNEIIWHYSGWNKRLKSYIERRHDTILFYAKAKKQTFYYPTRSWDSKDEYVKARKQKLRIDEKGREYVLSDAGGGKRIRRFIDEAMSYGVPLDDVWFIEKINNSDKLERTGYPTQKPLALLERIIQTSSNEGGMVLDPFCGCATTCVAAEHLNRQWIGIDISIIAYDLVRDRLTDEAADPGHILQFRNQIHLKTDPPQRTDLDVDYRERKFVYIISHPAYPGEYKVEIAKNAQARLVAYQTADPERAYKIEYKLETPYFRELEKRIHDLFPNKHEWVQADLHDIKLEMKNYKPE